MRIHGLVGANHSVTHSPAGIHSGWGVNKHPPIVCEWELGYELMEVWNCILINSQLQANYQMATALPGNSLPHHPLQVHPTDSNQTNE